MSAYFERLARKLADRPATAPTPTSFGRRSRLGRLGITGEPPPPPTAEELVPALEAALGRALSQINQLLPLAMLRQPIEAPQPAPPQPVLSPQPMPAMPVAAPAGPRPPLREAVVRRDGLGEMLGASYRDADGVEVMRTTVSKRDHLGRVLEMTGFDPVLQKTAVATIIRDELGNMARVKFREVED